MMKQIYVFLFALFLSADAFAVFNINCDDVPKCGAPETDDFMCFGDAGCDNTEHVAREHNSYGIIILAAVKSVTGGQKYCPIQVESNRVELGVPNKASWTTYSAPNGTSSSKCFWLCKPGYSGEECSEQVANATTCDLTELKESDFSSVENVKWYINIEYDLPLLCRAYRTKCGDNTLQSEVDVIMAVKSFLPSGHGAWVYPLVVHARHSGNPHSDDFKAFPNVYPMSAPEVRCKNGYTQNATKDDCIPINQGLCDNAGCKKLAPTFDDAQHTVVNVSETACKFRCTAEEHGFKSATDHTCVECKTTLTQGVSDETGTCITCSGGEVYDRFLGRCDKAYMLNGNDLQYGHGKTKNSQQDISKQCWTMKDMDDFRDCVLGAIKQ